MICVDRHPPLTVRTMKEVSPPLEIYNEFHDDIQAIFRSRLQTQVMIALGSGSKPLSTLREITGEFIAGAYPEDPATRSPALRRIGAGGDYALTPPMAGSSNQRSDGRLRSWGGAPTPPGLLGRTRDRGHTP
ncbi:hypothetical protein [Methanoculleus chikugoensis]|uniref:hypothetical protein n=1 Tax=Methanoculleus chikugoensis TaxID=118126 RepID=UPI000A794A82|nr:hypothetical protein [Methanoculleus chikugoensis]